MHQAAVQENITCNMKGKKVRFKYSKIKRIGPFEKGLFQIPLNKLNMA